ncbi:transmembrane emp24 domain-containing protein 1-like [Scyliorhinus canicula]|uniref:transmembrane emp24 domain-containing protein 1-like n=1 Tax=Scyliorhinus canicula TaxID=7830 RepID=UPI0018F40107|nr:transmembrane emp24 domain-containing protein 1-like [Scyliorhinus canicula]
MAERRREAGAPGRRREAGAPGRREAGAPGRREAGAPGRRREAGAPGAPGAGRGLSGPGLLSLLLLPSLAAAAFTPPSDSEFTFVLPPGRQECFYQSAGHNSSGGAGGGMELEYQVIGGAGLDVDFTVFSPNGESLISESRKSDGVHMIDPTIIGDYKICFDNSFSTISEKLIFFEVIFDDAEEDWSEIAGPEEILDIKIDDIKESIGNMNTKLAKSVQIQAILRAFEARDRNLQEGNSGRVNFWSAVNLGVMLAVSFVQVYMLKSLFDDRRKVQT